MHLYNDSQGALPAAVRGPDGKPLLSWRVLLLPYINEESLFKEFKLTEPWDSPHNIKLLDRMPSSYLPFRDAPIKLGHTYYQVIVGPGTPFGGAKARKIEDIVNRDKVLMIAEAKETVPWTKPDDLAFEPDGELPAFGGIHRDGRFRAVMVDGSLRHFQLADHDAIRDAITGRVPQVEND